MKRIQTQNATLEGIWVNYLCSCPQGNKILDDMVVKTIFIGYKHEGYKLYNPMTKKVIISRDVTFAKDEE